MCVGQVYRFLVRFYGDAGEKVDAAAAAYFGGRCAVGAMVFAGVAVPAFTCTKVLSLPNRALGPVL